MGPNRAWEIDCEEIGQFFPGTTFPGPLKGFVVIMSPVELDVTAVYTARPSNGEVSTIDVEEIVPRRTGRLALQAQDLDLIN